MLAEVEVVPPTRPRPPKPLRHLVRPRQHKPLLDKHAHPRLLVRPAERILRDDRPPRRVIGKVVVVKAGRRRHADIHVRPRSRGRAVDIVRLRAGHGIPRQRGMGCGGGVVVVVLDLVADKAAQLGQRAVVVLVHGVNHFSAPVIAVLGYLPASAVRPVKPDARPAAVAAHRIAHGGHQPGKAACRVSPLGDVVHGQTGSKRVCVHRPETQQPPLVRILVQVFHIQPVEAAYRHGKVCPARSLPTGHDVRCQRLVPGGIDRRHAVGRAVHAVQGQTKTCRRGQRHVAGIHEFRRLKHPCMVIPDALQGVDGVVRMRQHHQVVPLRENDPRQILRRIGRFDNHRLPRLRMPLRLRHKRVIHDDAHPLVPEFQHVGLFCGKLERNEALRFVRLQRIVDKVSARPLVRPAMRTGDEVFQKRQPGGVLLKVEARPQRRVEFAAVEADLPRLNFRHIPTLRVRKRKPDRP